ncbi:hypothetical protein FSP39_009607 [Pinctada imbricata]|uniref:CCHC-type domain-containing protein n=1 Tax=Pinctada imbricata TaxID=66713 RepID=A0AA88YNC2_PINIB|nr:hypothetical protein FSP39_009607 [Pinctada imbricata]
MTNTETNRSLGTTQGCTLLIGSSVLQRIKLKGLKRNVRVSTNRGAQPPQIRRALQRQDLQSFSTIIIQAGGNDAANNRDYDSIENDLIAIITDIQEANADAEIFFSTVFSRADVDVSVVNDIIRDVCWEYNINVIPCDERMYDPNSYLYWWDRKHLSDRGTAVLLKLYDSFVLILKSRDHRARDTTCDFCGERGHTSRRCRHGDQVECWNCRQFGHKAKLCRYNTY